MEDKQDNVEGVLTEQAANEAEGKAQNKIVNFINKKSSLKGYESGITKTAKGVANTLSKQSVFTALLSAYSGWSSYGDARDSGESVGKSIAIAAKDLVLPELMGGMGYLAYSLTPAITSGLVSGYENINMRMRRNQRNDQTPFSNYTFRDSETLQQMRASSLALAEQAVSGNFTTRQRGVAAARGSQFANMGYGSEASDMYM